MLLSARARERAWRAARDQSMKELEQAHSYRAVTLENERFRLAPLQRRPEVQAYLTALSISITATHSPARWARIICPQDKPGYEETDMLVSLYYFGPEKPRSLSFDIWKMDRQALPKLLQLDHLVDPPSWVRPFFYTQNIILPTECVFVVKDEDLKNPDYVWLCPARVWGQRKDGTGFYKNYAQELAAAARRHILEIPQNRLITPVPVAPH